MSDLPQDIFQYLFSPSLGKDKLELREFKALSCVSKNLYKLVVPLFDKIDFVTKVWITDGGMCSFFYDAQKGVAVSAFSEGTRRGGGKICNLRTGEINSLNKKRFLEIGHFVFSPKGTIFGITKRGEYGLTKWDSKGRYLEDEILRTPFSNINTIAWAEGKGIISGAENAVFFHDQNLEETIHIIDIEAPTKLIYDKARDILLTYSNQAQKITLIDNPFVSSDSLIYTLSFSVTALYSTKMGLLAYAQTKNLFCIGDVVQKANFFHYDLDKMEAQFSYIDEASSHLFLVAMDKLDPKNKKTFMYVWKIEDREVRLVNRFGMLNSSGLYTLASSMFFLPDSAMCVTAYYGSLDFWDIITGKLKKSVEIESNFLSDLQYDAGKFYVTTIDQRKNTYTLYRID